jgi:hypothetical protein
MHVLKVLTAISVIFTTLGGSSNVKAYSFSTTSCEDYQGYEICITKISKDKISKMYEGKFHYEFNGAPVFDGIQTDWDEVYFNFNINCSKNSFKIRDIFVEGGDKSFKKLSPKLRTRLIKLQTNAWAKPLKQNFCPLFLWPKVHA